MTWLSLVCLVGDFFFGRTSHATHCCGVIALWFGCLRHAVAAPLCKDSRRGWLLPCHFFCWERGTRHCLERGKEKTTTNGSKNKTFRGCANTQRRSEADKVKPNGWTETVVMCVGLLLLLFLSICVNLFAFFFSLLFFLLLPCCSNKKVWPLFLVASANQGHGQATYA